MKVSVIVPAAGQAARFGGKQNKIFERLDGRPVFLRTLELFASRDDVCQLLLVVSLDDRATINERYAGNLGLMDVRLVTGGAERSDSVRSALAEVDEQAELVAVHDAVRPCVSPLWIDAVFAAAAKTGAAILAYPVHGTLKKVSAVEADPAEQILLLGEPIKSKKFRNKQAFVVDQTVPRNGLWQAQTPQVFRRQLLVEAYVAAGNEQVTDDAQLVERMGQRIAVVLGDPRNVKITTPADLAFAEAVIRSLPKPKPKTDGSPFAEAQW
ncbi:MAG: 2-C-methyl-D-erythritol 4-phosphate cytidylyltransferase [Planctomycetes bacterium]|nr:2-C-methyl-D-erythritol 4-phosphate cytidylyltransferase [Planctomycetota bacterium]